VEDTPGDVRILSPSAGTLYLLSQKGAISRGIPFKGYSDFPGGHLYWFVNGKLSGTSLSGETIYLSPPPGKVDVRLVDEEGHWKQVISWVEYVPSPHLQPMRDKRPSLSQKGRFQEAAF
jgi:hypothetical protein